MLIYLRSYISKHFTFDNFLRENSFQSFRKISLTHYNFKEEESLNKKSAKNKDGNEIIATKSKAQAKKPTVKALSNFSFISYEKQKSTQAKAEIKISYTQESINEFKREEESAAIKVAKLINQLDPIGIAEKLMEPIKNTSVKNSKKASPEKKNSSDQSLRKSFELLKKLSIQVSARQNNENESTAKPKSDKTHEDSKK